MASTINASVSPTTGLISTADNTGILALQSNGSTGLTLNTSLAIGVGSTPNYGTSGQALVSSGTGASPTWSSVAAPATATTFTATQTFSGTSSTLAMILSNAAEVATISATAATGTIAYDVTTQSVLYYTTNASANWTVNFRGSSGTSLNTLMSTGQTMTVVFMVTQGATAYYNSAVQVDGASVTPKWQGGTAPTAGNASGIDVYSYTIIKTGSAAFTVLAAQVQFK